MVLNSAPFFQNSDVLETYGSPAAYFSKDEFKAEITKVVANIKSSTEFLKTVPRQKVIDCIYNMLLFAAASMKHPGFKEEQEWRLIHLPKQSPSKVLEESVETINGVPQIIYKLPLIEAGGIDTRLSALLNKIIIGPSNFPYPLYSAFVTELKKAGVAGADTMVVASDIPLRT
jgi:hypothetical protein